MNLKVIEIYTDGSCNARTKKGGYGVYMKIRHKDGKAEEKRIFRGFNKTKTGRMEIGAVLRALVEVSDMGQRNKVVIYSDSEYVVNTIGKKWYINWESRDYDGIKNKDLWENVIAMLRHVEDDLLNMFIIKWVKGHSGIVGNEIADGLAKQGYMTPEEESTDDYYDNDTHEGGFNNW